MRAYEIAFWNSRDGLAVLADWRSPSRFPSRLARTSDGGRTWHRSPEQITAWELEAVPGSQTAFARTPTGLMRTDDRGISWRLMRRRDIWSLTFATPRVGWGLVDDFAASNGVNLPKRILATTDGGRTWRPVATFCQSGFWFSTAVALATPERGWVVCGGQGNMGWQVKATYATLDGGKTWALRSGHTPAGRRAGSGLGDSGILSGIAFSRRGSGWLWGGRGPFRATRDGGRSWSAIDIGSVNDVGPWSVSRVSDLVGFVLFDGLDGRVLRVTNDGGRSWSTAHLWKTPGS